MLTKWIITAIAALIGAWIIPGVTITSAWTAFVFVIVLGLLNATLGRILRLAGCLINIVTFGLFDWIINAVVILLAGRFVSGIHIKGFMSAILLGLIMSAVTTFLEGRVTTTK